MYAYEIIMTLVCLEVDRIPFFLSHCYMRQINGFKMGQNMKSSIVVNWNTNKIMAEKLVYRVSSRAWSSSHIINNLTSIYVGRAYMFINRVCRYS